MGKKIEINVHMKSDIGEMIGIDIHMKNCSCGNKIPVQASDIHGCTYIWMMSITAQPSTPTQLLFLLTNKVAVVY